MPAEIGKLAALVAACSSSAPHLVGVYALGKCQRSSALLREAGYDKRIWLHGGLMALCKLYQEHGVDLGDVAPVSEAILENLQGRHRALPALGASPTAGRGASPIRSPRSARAGCGCARAPGSAAPSCRWSSPTMPTGRNSRRPCKDVGAPKVWVTHGREEALVHYALSVGIDAEALHLAGREDEDP